MKIKMLIDYSAAPPASAFALSNKCDLQIIRSEIMAAENAALATEWSRAAWETDKRGVTLALAALDAGQQVYVAEDEDGYYFATEERCNPLAQHEPDSDYCECDDCHQGRGIALKKENDRRSMEIGAARYEAARSAVDLENYLHLLGFCRATCRYCLRKP